MKKLSISLAIVAGCFSMINAQNYIDALRYTQLFPTGSARSVSMGNAFTSLGGDMSSFYTNPAGLGVYRKSEFVFSPGFNYSKTEADYYGSSAEDFKYKLRLNNIGYIGTHNSNKSTGWVSASFGIAYNLLKDFNSTNIIRGTNPSSSMVDYFFDYNGGINGTDPEVLDPFYERLAFDAFIIDTIPGSNYSYDTPVLLPVDQRSVTTTKGGIGEYAFAFGTNFSHKLYIGATLSILSVNYSEIIDHTENDPSDGFEYFNFNRELNTKGTGFTFRMGLIARPVEFLRIGASISLPTVYKLEDEFYSRMTSGYVGSTIFPTNSNGNRLDVMISDYKVVTPFKANGGVGVQIGKVGLISVDAEFINYSNMRLREGNKDFYYDNIDITDAFRKVVNLRAGGEVRFGAIALRGGFGYLPSPYKKNELNADLNNMEISGGIGIRQDNFFIDFGTVYGMSNEKYKLYDFSDQDENPAELNQSKLRFVTSIGFRF